jgi:uncharacterized repeat protein (TIGR01451 family)
MGKRIGIIIMSVLIGVSYFWSDDNDTPAGTNIVNNVTLDYEDENGNTRPQVSASETTTVTPMYGLSGPGNPADGATPPGVPIYYTYQISNEGNATDTYSLSLSGFTYNTSPPSPGGAWSAQIIQDDNQDGVHQSGETTVISALTLAEDQDAYFFVEVTPATDAENGSTGSITITVSTSQTPVGEYTGDNGNTYGGPNSVSDTCTTTCRAPDIQLAVSANVSTPDEYSGGTNDPVPGATITYTIIYDNDGNALAQNVYIIDVVPTNTGYVVDSAETSNSLHTGSVTVEYFDGSSWQPDTWDNTNAENVQQIRWMLSANVAVDDGDPSGSAEDENPTAGDTDAGTLQCQVTID